MSTQGSQGENHVLTASVRDLRHFATLLRGINISKKALIEINDVGMIVTVEEARSLLATAWIQKGVFDEFVYHPPGQNAQPDNSQEADPEIRNALFEVLLQPFVDCLNIFNTAGGPSPSTKKKKKYRGFRNQGSDSDSDGGGAGGASGRSGRSGGIGHYLGSEKGTGMRMSYAGKGYPLTILIAEDAGGPTATSEVTTYEPDPILDLPFDADMVVLRIILKSSWLQDALSELQTNFDKLTIFANPPPAGKAPSANAPPMLRLRAIGTYGTAEMDYPNDREVLETCDCTAPVSFTYKAAQIVKTLAALRSSLKTSLRIDEEGLLSMQMMVPIKGAKGKAIDGFVEFRSGTNAKGAVPETSPEILDAFTPSPLMLWLNLFLVPSVLLAILQATPTPASVIAAENSNAITTREDILQWIATTPSELTFIGDPIEGPSPHPKRADAVDAVVIFCSVRGGTSCQGPCTVYRGGTGCIETPTTNCLKASANVSFCNTEGCQTQGPPTTDGFKHCHELSTCGEPIDDGFCFTPGTVSVNVLGGDFVAIP
ncbi:ssDNA endodeoxyribonuclease [Steccherinum ochraceum]|uniref:SsDNA endodeoxyribonuclease n=1 Tax=Steccherinum ochraceum TaxID=92696 RepID=A0A4R0R1J8_9APHY|nr:ssDNA endodeoxyribonuclease [Steccherinum ochraceum]